MDPKEKPLEKPDLPLLPPVPPAPPPMLHVLDPMAVADANQRIVLESIDHTDILYIENGVLILNNRDDGNIGPGHLMYSSWMEAFYENADRDIEIYEFIFLMKMPLDHIKLCVKHNVFRGHRTFTRIEF